MPEIIPQEPQTFEAKTINIKRPKLTWHLIAVIVMTIVFVGYVLWSVSALRNVSEEIKRVDTRITTETELWVVGEKMVTVKDVSSLVLSNILQATTTKR